jgi:hypothetical protein
VIALIRAYCSSACAPFTQSENWGPTGRSPVSIIRAKNWETFRLSPVSSIVPPAGKLTDNGFIGQLVAKNAKVSGDTLVQLFCLFLSGLIGGRYEYERTRISG